MRPELAINFYCDESSQSGHRFVVLGSLAVLQNRVNEIKAALQVAREKHGNAREMGWTCVGKYKYGAYEQWLDIFVEFARQRHIRMTTLILDTQLPRNRRWNSPDRDLGFNKLLYQLILHRVGCKYAPRKAPIYGFLDSRTTIHQAEDLTPMLNGGLRNKLGCDWDPFRRIRFIDSKKSDLIQLVDIIIGGIAFSKNRHGDKEDARPNKVLLSARICELQQTLAQFDTWDFEYREKIPRA
jgi:Protein of unknown function (DUF3800)